MELIIASHNQNKLIEFKKILGDKITLYNLSDYNLNEEIPEHEDTIKKNAIFKALTLCFLLFLWQQATTIYGLNHTIAKMIMPIYIGSLGLVLLMKKYFFLKHW